MAAEGDLFARNKNSDFDAVFALGCCVAGKDESGFLEVGLARQGCHFRVAQTACVREHGERIAFKAVRSENVDLNEVEMARALIGIRKRGGIGFSNGRCYPGRACRLQKAATALFHTHKSLPWLRHFTSWMSTVLRKWLRGCARERVGMNTSSASSPRRACAKIFWSIGP